MAVLALAMVVIVQVFPTVGSDCDLDSGEVAEAESEAGHGQHKIVSYSVVYLFVLQFVVNLQQNGKWSLMCGMPWVAVR